MQDCKLLKDEYILPCDDYSQYKEYEDCVYAWFSSLYENGRITYDGKEVKMKHYPPSYDARSGFYHIICENYSHTGNEEDRKPNFERCKRIKWPKEIIEWCSNNCEKVWIWENERHNKKNLLIYCPENDYLVVLGKRNNYYLLTTAYVVEYEHSKRTLIKEYNKAKTNNASPK